ncbi:MAG: amidohydrolase [Deltaproteobacteria bacterium]|nr:amidohydrolase [Deltaproteobacteria bacterium]
MVDASAADGALLQTPLAALDDDEGLRVPLVFDDVIDAHVHLFPDGVFDALWNWFEKYGWPIRYRLRTPQIVPFLQSRGVQKMVALHYAHKPNMARALNEYLVAVQQKHVGVRATATVFPGEEDAVNILGDAFDSGLYGVKLHCHVQRFAPDADELHEIYALCEAREMPIIMHAGQEPNSPAYGVDVYSICDADRIRVVLENFPRLKMVVPHLGANEFAAYLRLMHRFEHLYVDTTMMLGGFFDVDLPFDFFAAFSSRVFYGSDFPSLPYAWDRELKHLENIGLSEDDLRKVSFENAARFFRM